jgi:hypothetical protein
MCNKKYDLVLFLIITLLVLPSACTGATSTSSSMTPVSSTPSTAFSRYDLAYKIFTVYPDYFWCDPDSYPVARDEMPNALEQFASIQADTGEFSAILKQTGLSQQDTYSDKQKLTIYREHKKLNRALTLTPEGDHYAFTIRTGQNQGKSIQGTISASGTLKVLKETESFNTCPICLTRGTVIATPSGDTPVERLKLGLTVWSVDSSGSRLAVPILKTCLTPVPLNFQVIRITLADGRGVTTSPNHPAAELRPLGDFGIGDILDGSPVSGIEYLAYDGEATFDLLPGGPTGFYYANGILLGSTLLPD